MYVCCRYFLTRSHHHHQNQHQHDDGCLVWLEARQAGQTRARPTLQYGGSFFYQELASQRYNPTPSYVWHNWRAFPISCRVKQGQSNLPTAGREIIDCHFSLSSPSFIASLFISLYLYLSPSYSSPCPSSSPCVFTMSSCLIPFPLTSATHHHHLLHTIAFLNLWISPSSCTWYYVKLPFQRLYYSNMSTRYVCPFSCSFRQLFPSSFSFVCHPLLSLLCLSSHLGKLTFTFKLHVF